ncbi:hypothetical protein BG011_000131 [Mortierella polycephala]|uniref:Uncharacterized protein n=1 Tax=Mortierella polycephala TaxID=41804 RepID=A0A9P6TVJ4_9FUNG|nr:hypothetical protein BG011_000131 [Mortierella polycephala]
MSNILSPIVTRYSLFFTIAMFSSSRISQSKQPTLLVQTLLLDAQQRYQDKATQTCHKAKLTTDDNLFFL